jgi:exportin-T
VRALQDTDVAQHAHPQVVLMYYEVSYRYLKFLEPGAIQRLFLLLLGKKGVLHPKSHMRSRCAYLVHKIAESQEGKAVNLLEAAYQSLAGKEE